MQAINHTLTAGLIAITVKEPALIAPLALGSHFVLDMLPHYGEYPRFGRGTKAYYRIIAADGVLTLIAYLVLIHAWPQLWFAISVGVFFALLPDLLWPLALYVKQRGPLWAFFRFHKNIQRESLRGSIVEGVWLVGMTWVLAALH